MTKSQIDGPALLLAVVACAFGFSLLNGTYFWIASIAGLCLACVLLAFDRDGQRSVFESLGYSTVAGLAFTLAATLPIAWLRHNPANGPFVGPIPADWILPYIWVGATVLVVIIDRARMSGRVPYAPQVQPVAIPYRTATVATPAAEPLRATVYEPPVAPAPPPPPPPPPSAPAATPRPTFTRPSFSEEAPEPTALETPRVVERVPEPVVAPTPPVYATPAATPPPAAVPVAAAAAPIAPAAPQAISIPPGKEAMIYVSLVGEGLNVLRAVRAEHMGRDFYRIAEPMPDGEMWQYGPGQIVRCRKKNLSSGKAMVAVEEAPRAN